MEKLSIYLKAQKGKISSKFNAIGIQHYSSFLNKVSNIGTEKGTSTFIDSSEKNIKAAMKNQFKSACQSKLNQFTLTIKNKHYNYSDSFIVQSGEASWNKMNLSKIEAQFLIPS